MDRNEFMELVYETFADESDNIFANGIIEAADAYVEHEKAQLFSEDTTKDTISRQEAIDAINSWRGRFSEEYNEAIDDCENSIKELLSVQPEPHEGHWIGKYPTTHICSECGWLIPDSKVKVFAYCPNCGAKMTISTK